MIDIRAESDMAQQNKVITMRDHLMGIGPGLEVGAELGGPLQKGQKEDGPRHARADRQNHRNIQPPALACANQFGSAERHQKQNPVVVCVDRDGDGESEDDERPCAMCLAANCRLPTEHCQTEQPKQQPVRADLLRKPKHGGKHWKCESEDRSPFRCDSTDK